MKTSLDYKEFLKKLPPKYASAKDIQEVDEEI